MRLAPKALHLACILITPAVALFAGETADAPTPLPKTVAVAAFKNGLAFVLRQGEIPFSSGTARLAPIPAATLGTLWLAPVNPEARIDEIVAYRYNTPTQRPIQSIGEILRANAGKTVTITYQMKDYTGEVVGLKDAAPDPASTAPTDVRSIAPHEDYLLLRTDKRLMAFPLGGISMASLPEDATLHENVDRQSQALRLKLKGGSAKEKLSMGYLEHGLGWTPSYLISLTDDTNAQITMQAVVTDDAEDLQNAQLFFVVGVPNFAYANTLSPMSLQQSLVDFMRDAEREDSRKKSLGLLSNAISGQAAMFDKDEASSPINLTNGVDEMSSAPEEDLFLYSRSDVTLARGERATYSVFSGSVAYEHLYNWEVEDQPRVDAYGNVINPNQNPQDARADSVWHSIHLKNATKFPWTSAPALVVSGDKPVSQDTLTYTQKGATSTLRVTVATDIRASHEEREVTRQPEINHRRGYNYDLVTVEGKLKVKNFKTKQVHLAIGKTLRGKTEFQSDLGKTVQLGEGIESDNPRSRLTWDNTLTPGQERIVTYRYKIWVRA